MAISTIPLASAVSGTLPDSSAPVGGVIQVVQGTSTGATTTTSTTTSSTSTTSTTTSTTNTTSTTTTTTFSTGMPVILCFTESTSGIYTICESCGGGSN